MGFGDFDSLCEQAPIPLCVLVGPPSNISFTGHGIQPKCYARTIELANTLIFETAADFMHILALIMTTIMIVHVRSKFTAVGMLTLSKTLETLICHNSTILTVAATQAAKKSPPSSISTWY